jgi:hypothetical protein
MQEGMTRDALLFRMIPCGVPIQVFFCSSKSDVSSLTTFLSGINSGFQGVFYGLKEAKEEVSTYKPGLLGHQDLLSASI